MWRSALVLRTAAVRRAKALRHFVMSRRATVTKTSRLSLAAVCAIAIALGGAALRAQETRSTTLLTTEH